MSESAMYFMIAAAIFAGLALWWGIDLDKDHYDDL